MSIDLCRCLQSIRIPWIALLLSLTVAMSSSAQKPSAFPNLRIEKKPGQNIGSAVITLENKRKVVAGRALQAWEIMDGENAIVVVPGRKKTGEEEYHLRFYEGTSRKYRDLGAMAYAPTELVQAKLTDNTWVFAATGNFLGKPTISLTGMNGINGELRNASKPNLHDDQLTFLDANGNPKTLPIGPLLANDMKGVYEVTAQAADKIRYAQFLRTGNAILLAPDGHDHTCAWRTNGEEMIITEADGTEIRWRRESLKPVLGIPAGTRLNVRLLQPLSSEKSKEGTPVEAVLISPGTIDNKILMPQGTIFSGTVTDRDRVGWGFRHEAAGLTLAYTSAKLPDGTTLAIHTILDQIENSRETVNEKGVIKGPRATGTTGHTAEKKIASVASIDPIAYLFANTAASATLGFSDPEVRYAAGTEMLVRFLLPAITEKTFPRAVPEFPASADDQASLGKMIEQLPFRTATKISNKPSDITNLVFIGPPEGLRRAFAAAGWIIVDQLTAGSTFLTLKTIGGNQVYNEAPMSTLLLNGQGPIFTMTKTTNTFSSRHHLRIFDPGVSYQGQQVLTSSSTQDIRIAFSRKQKTFIHVIDEYIDNERSKVVNDLEFTGCVEAMDLVPRPWVPLDAYNSTGDRLRTDGAVAVIKINQCDQPRTTPTTPMPRALRGKRITRDTVLSIRDDLYRGNLIYSGISGALWVKKYFATRDQLQPVKGAWRTTDQSGTEFRGVGESPLTRTPGMSFMATNPEMIEKADEQARELELLHRWDPPHYEIGIQASYMRYPTTRNEVVVMVVEPDPGSSDPPFVGVLADQYNRGWTAGISATLNTWKWFSNQFTYSYTRGIYQFGAVFSQPPDTLLTASVGVLTRQFEYNLLWNFRPPKSRWRPYAAVGPAILLTHLADAPLKKSAGPFKLGLQNIGLFLAAYNFGHKPPLDGGGIFSAGLVYGAGVKYRILPRLSWNVDFRETWAQAPNFLTESYTHSYFDSVDYNLQTVRVTTNAKYRMQRFTTGFAFTF